MLTPCKESYDQPQFSSVQFSRSVVSSFLRPHESQHARPPCLSPTPGVHPDSRPLSQWCRPAVSSSVVPFLLLPSVFPSIRVFSNESTLHMRWPKFWSFRFSIIPSKEHPGLISFRMDWFGLYMIPKFPSNSNVLGYFLALSRKVFASPWRVNGSTTYPPSVENTRPVAYPKHRVLSPALLPIARQPHARLAKVGPSQQSRRVQLANPLSKRINDLVSFAPHTKISHQAGDTV